MSYDEVDLFRVKVDEFVHETTKAVLVDVDGTQRWLPKSQIDNWPDAREEGEVVIPEWLMEVNHLDPYGEPA